MSANYNKTIYDKILRTMTHLVKALFLSLSLSVDNWVELIYGEKTSTMRQSNNIVSHEISYESGMINIQFNCKAEVNINFV